MKRLGLFALFLVLVVLCALSPLSVAAEEKTALSLSASVPSSDGKLTVTLSLEKLPDGAKAEYLQLQITALSDGFVFDQKSVKVIAKGEKMTTDCETQKNGFLLLGEPTAADRKGYGEGSLLTFSGKVDLSKRIDPLFKAYVIVICSDGSEIEQTLTLTADITYSCVSGSGHTYTSDCDTLCDNGCGEKRKAPKAHTFSSCEDGDCDICGSTVATPHHEMKKGVCTLCGYKESGEEDNREDQTEQNEQNDPSADTTVSAPGHDPDTDLSDTPLSADGPPPAFFYILGGALLVAAAGIVTTLLIWKKK